MDTAQQIKPSRPHRVLIVTDRYPPETVGGAELSLHEVLTSMAPMDWDCWVLALSERRPPARESDYVFEGIRITSIPVEARWPPGVTQLKSKIAEFRGPVGRILGSMLQLRFRVRYIFQSPRGFLVRLRRAFLLVATRLVGRTEDYQGSVEEMVSASDARAILQAAIQSWQPDIIHCDNKDSIVLVGEADRGKARMVAMVRDNRFFCAHSQQQMKVGNSVCRECSLGCVSDMNWPLRPLLQSEMRRTAILRRFALLQADRVLTTSHFLAHQIKSLGAVPRVVVVSNPHPSVKSFELATGDVHQAAPPEILYAGNLKSAKGPLLLMECLTQISEKVHDFQIVFAGRGQLEYEIEERARRAGMAHRVRLVGFLDRPSFFRQLARSSVVVAPALCPEPFGRLPLEAGIARRPIVASALGGHLETVQDGKTGILFPPGERESLANAIIKLLLDPALANQMGLAGREHVIQYFAPDTIAGRISAAWRDVLRTR